MQQNLTVAVQQKKTFLYGLQHELVYTRGLTTRPEDILLQSIDTVVARRGGSVTLHNKGQLVFYLVMPLEFAPGGLDGLIRLLEAAIIETLASYHIVSFCHPPHSGVFTRSGKIAFAGLGMKASCIYHGVAVNINNDLNDYKAINSCGLTLPVARLIDLLTDQKPPSLKAFSDRLAYSFIKRFEPRNKLHFKSHIRNEMQSGSDPMMAFRLGMNFFNERKFWEAHEAWELFWLFYNKQSSEFKDFMQGLIQLAMGLYKLTEKPNFSGAKSLLTKSINKLENNSYLPRYIHRSDKLIAYIINTLQVIEEINGDVAVKKVFSPYVLMSQVDYVSFYQNL